MERLKHIGVPAGDCCIGRTDGIEEVRNNGCFYTGHIAGRDKDEIAPGRSCTGMQSSDRADALPDIRDAPDILQCFKAPALFRVFGNDDDLVSDMPERVHETLDERLPLVLEKKFFLPVDPAGFPADKDDGGSHGCSLLPTSRGFAATDRPTATAPGIRTRTSGIMGKGKTCFDEISDRFYPSVQL
jgi:hypothetical protein